MKAICFHCKFQSDNSQSRCPACGFPLIAVAKPTTMLEIALSSNDTPAKGLPLPGLSAEPRQAQLLMERRKQRIAAMHEEKRRAQSQPDIRVARGSVVSQMPQMSQMSKPRTMPGAGVRAIGDSTEELELVGRMSRRKLASVFAASAMVALGLLATLNAMGAI